MIDSAAEDLARRILVVFPPSTARTRADVKRVPIPVGRLLAAELDARADRFASLPATEWLDRDDEHLPEARATWREAVRAAARFPADVWEEAVAQATRLAVSHLVRPAETAAADAFADADGLSELPIGAALARVRVFGAYGYLPEIAARYAERKGVADIDRPGLERLLRRIDRRMVEDFGPDEWTALTGPLYDLVGSVSTPEGTVGVGLLRALFEAKGRHEMARTLISDTYTQSALHAHLAAVMPRPAPAPSAPAAHRAPAEPESGIEPESPAPPAEPVTAVEPAPPSSDTFSPELPHAPELERQTLAEPAASPDAVAPETTPEPAPAAEATPGAWPLDALPSTAPADERPAPDETDTPSFGGADPDTAPPAKDDVSLEASPVSDADPVADESSAAEAAVADASAADAEPLWKRMLQRPEAEPRADRPLAATPDPDALVEPDTVAPLDTPVAAPATPAEEPEPLWRRFAAPEPLAELDDEDGWAVAPTLAATPTAALPDTPLPAQTLADTFARPDALPPADRAPLADASGPSLEAVELTVLGSGPDDRREWFVNALFDASLEDYEDTLNALAAAPSWTAATQIIASEVFRKHRVNIYSEAAIAFTDAVETQINERT